ncbi:hypothetical protein OB236_15175 [Paenibacillus sp. WQ 127069]|uniref:Uncharacterized protein n=1 Tax=Paenibacillus baimaensis TaxID=2982185 RepID=A0ABT2UFM5_9BACL|nr:hypothetical protein [Paenibacillus sp. WQ 127069]MCU6793448.1 hypothetical protein [Paenibacillus sp. WQ 127069]
MEDWPEWLVESLHKRLDELALTVEKQEHIAPLIEKTSKLLTDLKSQVGESAHGILLEWEDAVQYQHSVEKVWLYLRMIKDGMGMNKGICNAPACQDTIPENLR